MEDISLKDKCYAYQEACNYRIDADKYILVHIDGRSFSKMVKNKFKKPFDDDFINMMNETARYLCEKVQGVKIAYVQSDEISLLLKKDNPESDIFFGGRLCKMQSIIASIATARFNQLMIAHSFKKWGADAIEKAEIEYGIETLPIYQFDCKVWTVDNANDALAWFLFRNIDCVKNSKQQAAQSFLSHNDLMGHNADEQVSLLFTQMGIDWKGFEEGQKYGRIVSKEEVEVETENGPCIRNKWVVKNGFDLTNRENREKMMEMCPSFKEN